MKEVGTLHWLDPNGATNESNFTGLPGGFRDYDGTFKELRYSGNWWSSLEYDAAWAWHRALAHFAIEAYRGAYNKKDGFSVRCIKD